jgi:hypothetical protein
MTCARAIALGGVAGLLLAGCGGSTSTVGTGRRAPGSTSPVSSATPATTTRAVGPRHHRRHRRPAPDPGRLAQTHQLPSSRTHAFHAEMQTLWRAILGNRPGAADAAFFPESAYDQVKSIGDPGADWRYRLRADYRLDISAAHGLLGAPPPSTHLIGVSVPAAYAHWINPGVCENGVGYYEVPNSRMVYRERGAVRSFGIASMISWRGRWYVIHLGYVGKLSIGGRVDAPSLGAGISAPADIC